MKNLIILAMAAALFAGCMTPTTRIDTRNDRAAELAGIDYRNIEETITEMLESLNSTGRLKRNDGKLYILSIGRIENDTMQRLDMDNVVNYLTEELVNMGTVMVTSAMSLSETQKDEMISVARTVRGNDEFNQASVIGKSQLLSPDLSLTGKITQRELRMDNGDKQVEFYFSMTITDLHTGIRFWQKQHLIGKRTDARRPTW